jgi:hypothetical protein
MIKSPVEVIGDSTLNAEVALFWPVPPLAMLTVPCSVIVPAVVIGPPEVVRPVTPPETPTDVTMPLARPAI